MQRQRRCRPDGTEPEPDSVETRARTSISSPLETPQSSLLLNGPAAFLSSKVSLNHFLQHSAALPTVLNHFQNNGLASWKPETLEKWCGGQDQREVAASRHHLASEPSRTRPSRPAMTGTTPLWMTMPGERSGRAAAAALHMASITQDTNCSVAPDNAAKVPLISAAISLQPIKHN